MQISTRTEDFIVDTLKLRDHICLILCKHLRLWDWKERGDQLIRYTKHPIGDCVCCHMIWSSTQGRTPIYYLLYIHDVMITKLFSEYSNLLAQVFNKSYQVCAQLYENDLFDWTISYLYLHGLQDSNLDAKQLAAVSSLFEWRDKIAREEDESTGYVLPNKLLLEIAKRLPQNKEELLEIVGYRKPHVLRDAHLIVKGIQLLVRDDDANTAMFQRVSRLLKQKIPVSDIVTKVKRAEKGIDRKAERLMMYSNLRCQPNI